MASHQNKTLDLAAQLAAVSGQLAELTRKFIEHAAAPPPNPPQAPTMPGLLDHRDVLVDRFAYKVVDVATMLDASRDVVCRLIRSGQLAARHTGRSYRISGAAIREYLDGRDEPMRHPDSA